MSVAAHQSVNSAHSAAEVRRVRGNSTGVDSSVLVSVVVVMAV